MVGAVSPAVDRIKVVRETERESLWFLGDNVQWILTGAETEGRLTLGLHHARPASQPPLHEHDGEDEIFFLLEGQITFWSIGTEVVLTAGDCILLPKDVPHTFQVSPDREAKWLVILAPGGFEDFVRAASRPAEYPGPEKGWEMDDATEKKLVEAAAVAGITLLGPPGARP